MRRSRYTSEDFEHFVKVLIGRWNFALELQVEWASMDGEERMAHTEDWPINNAILLRLEEYAGSHELTGDQKAHWLELKQIVARHAKTLEGMGYPVPPRRGGRDKAVA